MQPDSRFRSLDKSFWANVRTVSEKIGYTMRGTDRIRIPSADDIRLALFSLGLTSEHLYERLSGAPTLMGGKLHEYLTFRADALNNYARSRLMDAQRANAAFDLLKSELGWTSPVPMNKQTGEKKAPAYLTGIVNMLISSTLGNLPFDADPRVLTTFTRSGLPLRTLARRVDGCFPGTVNPIAIWEIKEHYYTTTFGSRIADGVYESLLDGLELEELREHEGVDCQHVLIVDAFYTWWVKGRSYLCRLVDMLHMGYVDEVLFGYEVVERMPGIVRGWIDLYRRRNADGGVGT